MPLTALWYYQNSLQEYCQSDTLQVDRWLWLLRFFQNPLHRLEICLLNGVQLSVFRHFKMCITNIRCLAFNLANDSSISSWVTFFGVKYLFDEISFGFASVTHSAMEGIASIVPGKIQLDYFCAKSVYSEWLLTFLFWPFGFYFLGLFLIVERNKIGKAHVIFSFSFF